MSGNNHLSVVILAAGQGSRMKSSRPKVLHPLAGKALLQHVLDSAAELAPQKLVVVYGHGGEQVRQAIRDEAIVWAEQKEQKGTGHAVQQAMPAVADEHMVLILYGDVPLTNATTLAELVRQVNDRQMALLSVHLDNPSGYGRIVRDGHGKVQCIVEEKDASDAQRAISEINTGILAVSARHLKGWLGQLKNNNAQGEYYLTDIIAMAVRDGIEVVTAHPATEEEVMGVNSRAQLARLLTPMTSSSVAGCAVTTSIPSCTAMA
ncbi:MAG: NTP transferase domain-containing protein, partial [Gammaproteobacteria bacterium]